MEAWCALSCVAVYLFVNAGDPIRQLLVFSRKQKLDYKQVDLNQLDENFIKLLRRAIREDIEIKKELTGTLPLVWGDMGQLDQVVMNPAINAQDAMPEMNGRELVERMKKEYPHIRVMFMSGYPDDIIFLQDTADSEIPYAQKPFTIQSILHKVRESLEN